MGKHKCFSVNFLFEQMTSHLVCDLALFSLELLSKYELEMVRSFPIDVQRQGMETERKPGDAFSVSLKMMDSMEIVSYYLSKFRHTRVRNLTSYFQIRAIKLITMPGPHFRETSQRVAYSVCIILHS